MLLSASEKLRLHQKYGPWAVVTGATSGIGLEIATLLAGAGFNLVIAARDKKSLSTLESSLIHSCNIKVLTVSADLSTQEGVQKVIAATSGLDVGLLVLSAGYGTSGLFVESDLGQELNMHFLNNTALLMLTYHFGRFFKTQGRGGIVLMGSMVGFQGVPYAAHYAATKAYVQSLGEALALELKPYGVDVLTAAPGPVESRFGERAGLQMSAALKPSDVAIPILYALGRQATVLPGGLTKLLVGALRTVPRWGKVRIMQLVMGGMTKHQRDNSNS